MQQSDKNTDFVTQLSNGSQTIRSEIRQKCISPVQACFRFELGLTVLKLFLKIWVNPWNYEQILAVFRIFLREMATV